MPPPKSPASEEAKARACFSVCIIFNAGIFSLFLRPVEDSTGNPAARGSRKAQVPDCVTYINRDVIYMVFIKGSYKYFLQLHRYPLVPLHSTTPVDTRVPN